MSVFSPPVATDPLRDGFEMQDFNNTMTEDIFLSIGREEYPSRTRKPVKRHSESSLRELGRFPCVISGWLVWGGRGTALSQSE